jgi:hypothetical protein
LNAAVSEDAFQTSKHWRAVAEETRQKAEAMSSPELKERMLQIAADYEKLAEFVERVGGAEPPRSS